MEQAVFARSPSIALISRLGAAMHDAAPRMVDGDALDFFGGGAGLTMLQTILDHVHIGVTVVGPRYRLLFANRAALRACAHHPVLRIDRDRVVVLEAKHEGDLSRARGGARRAVVAGAVGAR
jgi:hypothetical protein